MKKKYTQYMDIFKRNNGILRATKAIKLGIPEHAIYRMTREGNLVQEARGLYRLAERDPLGNPDLIQVALLVPKSVVFLISALDFHGLTTQIPHKVYIAIPMDAKPPRIEYPPIRAYRLRPKSYESGIESHEIDGVQVRIYSKEKTITDCFKYRNQLGIELAIEALKDYMRSDSPDINRLMQFAKINRVQKTIGPYVDALL